MEIRNEKNRGFLYPLVILILLISLVPTSAYASSIRSSEVPPVSDASKEPKAYILVDANKGTILASKNEREALNVASTGKIITALAAINTIDRDKPIEIPKEAEEVQPMRIGMKKGEKWARDDLLYSLLLVSANDAAYALATASAGSIKSFSEHQNRVAKSLQMKDSTFGDPSGLDDELAINGESKMSAYDLAIASRALLANADLAKMVSTKNYQFMGGDNIKHTLTNHNDFFLDNYEGANGLKTGYTKKSGRTLVVSATRGENTLIAVVLNVTETNSWGAKLLDEGFEKIENGNVDKDAKKLPEIGVILSKANVTTLIDPTTKDGKKEQAIGTPAAVKVDSNSFLSVPLVSAFIIGLLLAAILWRRRVVKKRKTKRRLKAKQMQEIKRRSMIDVIDDPNDGNSELLSKK